MTAIQQVENWRISPANDSIPMPFIETQTDGGEWFFPDCGYVCRHCGMCMGCKRKFMMWDDEDGRGWRIVESEIRCNSSPTGYHVAIEDEEEEEEEGEE